MVLRFVSEFLRIDCLGEFSEFIAFYIIIALVAPVGEVTEREREWMFACLIVLHHMLFHIARAEHTQTFKTDPVLPLISAICTLSLDWIYKAYSWQRLRILPKWADPRNAGNL